MAVLQQRDAARRPLLRRPRLISGLALLIAAASPAAALLSGCGSRGGDGGTVAATVPKAQAQQTAAEAQATLPQSSRHDAARQAAGASGPGGRR